MRCPVCGNDVSAELPRCPRCNTSLDGTGQSGAAYGYAPPPPYRPIVDYGSPWQMGGYLLYDAVERDSAGEVRLAAGPGGRLVEIELLPPALVEDDEQRRRLLRELIALQRVSSPYLAEILDVDLDAEQPYIARRRVLGPSLEKLVERGGPLAGGELLRVAVETAQAVSQLHASGLVHRGVSPARVLVSNGGARLVDFVLGRREPLTATSLDLVGFSEFICPELLRGEGVAPTGDVFSWGATLAFAVTGRPPFGTGPAEAVMYRILEEEPDLAGVPDPLASLLRAALAKVPADRPTAAALVESLRDIDPETLPERPRPPARDPWPSEAAPERPWPPGGDPWSSGPLPMQQPAQGYASWAYDSARPSMPMPLGTAAGDALAAAMGYGGEPSVDVVRARVPERPGIDRAVMAVALGTLLVLALLAPVPALAVTLLGTFALRLAAGDGVRSAAVLPWALAGGLLPLLPDGAVPYAAAGVIAAVFLGPGSMGNRRAIDRVLPPPPAAAEEAVSRRNRARRLLRQGRHAEAERLLSDVMKWAPSAVGADLAAAQRGQGRTAEAERTLQRAVAAAERSGDREHVLSLRADLAAVQHERGDAGAAARLRALAEEAGPDHPAAPVIRGNLMVALYDQGRLDEAEQMAREALDAARSQRAVFPELWADLAAVRRDQGDLDGAAELLNTAVSARPGGGSPPFVTVALAAISSDRGRHAEAERLLQQAVAQRRQALGGTHPDTLRTRYNLALAHLAAGNEEAARTTLTGLVADCEQALGDDDAPPFLEAAREKLAGLQGNDS